MRLKQPSRRILFIVLILFTLYLLVLPRRWSAPPRAMLLSLTSPVQKQGSRFIRFLSDLWSGLCARRDLANENRALHEKIRQLENEWARMKDQLTRTEQKLRNFDALAKLPAEEGLKPLDANVIGMDASNWRGTLVIDRGTKDGVQAGQAVVWHDAVVGIVIEAGRSAGRVLLLVDPECRVAACDFKSREQGIIEGTGDGFCRMKHVARDKAVRENDLIVTSGIGGVFPASLLIGQVVESKTPGTGLFREIKVEPRVEFSRLENVLVLRRPETNGKKDHHAAGKGAGKRKE